MNALKGSRRLFRLSLRLDRIKLPLWILLTVGLIALTIPQLLQAYGTEAQRIQYALATAPSVVTRLLGGAITGPSIGEITVIETFLLAVLMITLINIFLVTRHTRKNEETGRGELIGSMLVGRQAMLTSALTLALLVNVACSAFIYGVYVINDLGGSGALLYSISIGLIGMTFACVAALTSQLFENTRAANGAAALVFGAAFLLRGLGDAFGKVNEGGMSVTTSFLSYLSPLGWSTNAKPFAENNWWMLLPFVLCIFVLLTTAYYLLAKRDIGSSVIKPKPGKLHAPRWLLSTFGMVWRTSRTVFIAWGISLVLLGASLGAIADEFKDLIAGNEEMQKMLAAFGGGKDPTDLMYAAIFTIAGIALAGFALQVMTKMASEESSGRLELTLSTKAGRVRWALTYILFALGGTFVILLVTGITAGISDGLISGGVVEKVSRLATSILVYVPAVAIMIGVGIILFGKLPRYFVALSWGVLGVCLLVFQLGALLDLPQWVINISPFTHTPSVPSSAITPTPLLWQSLVAVVLIATGLYLFRNRDIITE